MQRKQKQVIEEAKAAPARKERKIIAVEEAKDVLSFSIPPIANKKDKKVKADVVMDEGEEAPEQFAALSNKFSVGKIAKFCKHGRFSERIGAGTPVYIAAVLEYITCEILELANVKCQEEKSKKDKKRITPRHIMLAIKSDPELAELFKNITFMSAGVVPNLKDTKNDAKKKKRAIEETESEDSD